MKFDVAGGGDPDHFIKRGGGAFLISRRQGHGGVVHDEIPMKYIRFVLSYTLRVETITKLALHAQHWRKREQ